jgi:CAAX prenyl protease-like protein
VRLGADEPPTSSESSVVLRVLLIILMLYTLVLIIFSFPAGLYSFFSGKLSALYNFESSGVTYLWLGPIPTLLPFEVPLGVVFVALTAVYVAMFAWAARQPASPVETIRASIHSGVESLFESPFLLILISIGFVDFTDTVITYAVQASGGAVGNPFVNVDPFQELTSLAIAPLREEFGFRVLLIGLVALVLCMGRPLRQGLKALWRPSVAYEGLAVGTGAAVIVWAATVFSSVTFGVCHVFCGTGGGGWAWGKIIPATFGGLVLGYLYVRFGFHVAVLAHWGVDYFGSVYSFLGQAAYGINWNSNTTEFLGQYLVDFDIVYLFGLASFLVVLYVGIKKLVRWRSRGLQPDLVHKPLNEGVMAED